MGKIVVSDNVSLDGVIQDPAGDEGFRRGGWVGPIKDRPELGKLALDEALGAEALLLGRRSYEWFAARWPSRSGKLADRLNKMLKYVVSSTLKDPDWNNSTVLKGDVVDEVSKLKREIDGEIVVAASFRLVHTLVEHDLVDELRLKIFPVVLGDGKRLFGETSVKKAMRLVDTKTIDGDVAYLTCERVRERVVGGEQDVDGDEHINYYDTLVEVADDCPVSEAEVPQARGGKAKAVVEYELLVEDPYTYTEEDLAYWLSRRQRMDRPSEAGERS